MDCGELRLLVMASLHDELSDEARHQLEQHLPGCEQCRYGRDFELKFEEHLRTLLRSRAPTELRSRGAPG